MTGVRRVGIRRKLAQTLVGVSLVSVLLLASVNFFFARSLINDSIDAQLVALRDTRVAAFERGFERVEADIATLAANPSVVAALRDLVGAYDGLDQQITAAEAERLADVYETEFLPPFAAAGVDLGPTSELLPNSIAGRYVQHHYIAGNPAGFDERDVLDDADDGSTYSAAHSRHHPLLRTLKESANLSDLLLVDFTTGDVVYSVMKRVDLGSNVDATHLGLDEVVDRLSSVAVGDAAVADTSFYLPTRGSPVLLLAAAVSSGSEVVGLLIAELPVEVITAVTTANGDFGLLGLGEDGETYVVGADRTLRSDSRRWIEDPDGYLEAFVDRSQDEEAANVIRIVGSPVLIQTVDNEAVTAGLDGREFVGAVTNYLGTETFVAAAPVRVGVLEWVVVAEFPTSVTDAPLESYIHRMLVVLAVLLPAIAALGLLIARTLSRPIDALLEASGRIAAGDLGTEVEDLGRNELGDLGRQLEGVADQLRAQQRAVADEEQRIDAMLGAVLPARLIARVRSGETSITDVLDTATIVSLTVDALPAATGADQDVALEITDRIDEAIDELMDAYDVERLGRSTGSELFVAGLDHDDRCSATAARFALRAIEAIEAIGRELDRTITARAGLAAGDVATGVLGTGQMSFGIWGDPPGVAMSLNTLAEPGQALAAREVVEDLDPTWDIGPLDRVPGLADDIEASVIRRAPEEAADDS